MRGQTISPIQSVGECVNDIEKLVIGVHIWRVINNLVYRGKKSSHVGEIRNKHGETIDANDVPNAFNSHFTDLGKNFIAKYSYKL